MIRAVVLGAIAAAVGIVLLAFLQGTLFGMHPAFDEKEIRGLQGGVNALNALFLAVTVRPLVFLGVMGAGALIGAALYVAYRITVKEHPSR
jgi:hypothetical protein